VRALCAVATDAKVYVADTVDAESICAELTDAVTAC
jgi:hypothetical protein